VDVLPSHEDAETLMALWASQREPAFVPPDADRFRSHFARFRFPGTPVEVMGALEVFVDGGWQAVWPDKLVLVGVGGVAVPVPSIDDQVRLCERFGRQKDLSRKAALGALLVPTFSVPLMPPQ
jgi:hypothetical protein